MLSSFRPLRAAALALHLGAAALAAPLLAAQEQEIVLATTTSTADTGLLDSLLPMFREATGIAVKPIAVGTGAALEMARRGDADAVLVHAPESERAYIQSGDLIDGRRIMYNDFLILGPAADPAGARGKPLGDAMKAIAKQGSFVSRGDASGTEKKELELWKAAGVVPASLGRREETGQGMGATLLVAEQRQTYTLTDRATYLAFRDRLTLVPVVEGDPILRNIYSAYSVNPGKHPAAKRGAALRFVRYLTEPKVQEWIGRFGVQQWGEPLFHPDAASVARAH
jgi:tungstate transport system substrate-binding protein